MISLCSNCLNNEPGYQYDGKHYVQRDVCVYGMLNFPRATACNKHETTVSEDNDDYAE
jgi:hypothetical protein